VRVRIPRDALALPGRTPGGPWQVADRLATSWTGTVDGSSLASTGLAVPDMPPCSALMLEFTG